jgi:hypothetical protein
MPSTLRSRLSLLLGAAVFFLPALVSSPRGLTHLLTCRQDTQSPFSIVIRQGGHPVLATSEAGSGADNSLCGGLTLDMRASVKASETVTMRVILTNLTAHPWRGTVAMTVGGLLLPLPMGRIGPGGTASGSIDLHLLPGAHELEGALLLGP